MYMYTVLLTGPDPKSWPTVDVHASRCLCLQPQQQTGTLDQIHQLHSLSKKESSLFFVESWEAWSFQPLSLYPFQFTVECEWQRQEMQTVTVPVPHILSFGEFYSCMPPCPLFLNKLLSIMDNKGHPLLLYMLVRQRRGSDSLVVCSNDSGSRSAITL